MLPIGASPLFLPGAQSGEAIIMLRPEVASSQNDSIDLSIA